MPTYVYICDACAAIYEVFLGYHEAYDPSLCQSCGRGTVRRDFQAPTISMPARKPEKTRGLEMFNNGLKRDGKGGLLFDETKANA